MFREKTKQYPWLICQNKKLGCLTCQKIKAVGPNVGGSQVHIADEWSKVKVTAYGATRAAQLQSLRKKIHKHRMSDYHQAAEKTMETAKEKRMETLTSDMQRDHFLTTDRVFRTVYKIVKSARPFTDLPTDIDLQVMNGLDMGRTLHSDYSCATISRHIGSEMRKRVVGKVLQSGTKCSVLIDESTTDSKKSVLIIYIRASLGMSEEPLTFFLDLVELSATNADGIYQALMNNLSQHGFSEAIMKERFVCFASDGASVMLGSKSSVATKLVEKFPNVMVWHCMNHRLELSVGDAVEEIAGMNDFQFFFDKIYSLYHASAKNRRELTECCEDLALQCLNIGRILSTRWVASSYRTIKAVWQQYPALHKHFSDASVDPKRRSTERCMFSGLANRLSNATFVHNLGVMYDALEELSEFSLSLQDRNMTLPKAEASLSRQIRVLKSMAEQPGPRAEETQTAGDLKLFKGVPLTNNSRYSREINH
ncbi:E3 SUMO-protein ligase KIAA1586-like [Trematomus bernacchii]|uniref:E3 SUMO-protein ligase KIAA1586-like n=1 Tax=Trematomus bernacchii TaxID=40690 RepID=UPI00146F45A0|nr:E3 SUMO-protein ligase KIAA1586-like [Trematomus bernacchii]